MESWLSHTSPSSTWWHWLHWGTLARFGCKFHPKIAPETISGGVKFEVFLRGLPPPPPPPPPYCHNSHAYCTYINWYGRYKASGKLHPRPHPLGNLLTCLAWIRHCPPVVTNHTVVHLWYSCTVCTEHKPNPTLNVLTNYVVVIFSGIWGFWLRKIHMLIQHIQHFTTALYTVLNGWADTTCQISLNTYLAPIPLFSSVLMSPNPGCLIHTLLYCIQYRWMPTLAWVLTCMIFIMELVFCWCLQHCACFVWVLVTLIAFQPVEWQH